MYCLMLRPISRKQRSLSNKASVQRGRIPTVTERHALRSAPEYTGVTCYLGLDQAIKFETKLEKAARFLDVVSVHIFESEAVTVILGCCERGTAKTWLK